MSPHRQLSHSSFRKPSRIQDVFLGIGLQLAAQPELKDGQDPGRDLEYSLVLHDGTGVTESETFHFQYYTHDKDEDALAIESKRFGKELLGVFRKLEHDKQMKICLTAVAEPVPPEVRNRKVEFFSTVWLHLDSIPFLVIPSTAIFTKLPTPSTEANASAAVSTAIKHLHPATHSATTADINKHNRQVQVDCNGKIHLCSLTQYQESTSPQLWKRFMALSDLLRESKTSIHFFSATPQGGGVALMRHALIRLWKMVGVDVKWFVPEGHPAVFDITKRKIHNVLQGVAKKGIEMSDEDKRWFELWTEQNYESFWQRGAIDASLIVIDDPQLTAMIPIIKKKHPDAKIIFRSHIQIQSNLTDDPSTPQYRTWNFLYNFIKDVDLFLAHPVKFFVPKNVHDNLPVLYMAPSTDPLDGLNKPYGKVCVRYYRQYFNHVSQSQSGVTIDWERGYICQIARFDPSKGIDVLLESYMKFTERLREKDNFTEGPQLIIMGHGSVDDPDATVIMEQIYEILDKEPYQHIKRDVAAVRAPPSDAILGCILQGAWVATQLSTREGFEVKVTEAINKRVPIIASDAGGIPLQVKHGINGWVVPTSNSDAVADLLYDIWSGKQKVHRDLEGKHEGKTDPNSLAENFVSSDDQPMAPVHSDFGSTSEDFWTVGNATRWMLLTSKILGLSGTEADQGVLKSMEASEAVGGREVDGLNVWKMVMGEDMVDGEGEIR